MSNTKQTSIKNTSSGSDNMLGNQAEVVEKLTSSFMLVPKLIGKITLAPEASCNREALKNLFKTPQFIRELKNTLKETIEKMGNEEKENLLQLSETIKGEISQANSRIFKFGGVQVGNSVWQLFTGAIATIPFSFTVIWLGTILRLLNKGLIFSATVLGEIKNITKTILQNPKLASLQEITDPANKILNDINNKMEAGIPNIPSQNALNDNVAAVASDTVNKAAEVAENTRGTIKKTVGRRKKSKKSKNTKKSKKVSIYMSSKLRQHINKISRRTDKSIKEFLKRRKYEIRRTHKKRRY